MLEEYTELREEKEQERRRKRVLVLHANHIFNQIFYCSKNHQEQCL